MKEIDVCCFVIIVLKAQWIVDQYTNEKERKKNTRQIPNCNILIQIDIFTFHVFVFLSLSLARWVLFFAHTRVTTFAHFSHHQTRKKGKKTRARKSLLRTWHTCKFSRFRRIHKHLQSLSSPSLSSVPSHLFFVWHAHCFVAFVCVCIDVFFLSPSLVSRTRARAHTHTHTHIHISKSSFVFLPSFLSRSLLIACWRRLAFFFSLSLFFSRVCACVVPCARSSSSSSSSSSLSSSPFSTMPTSWAPPDRSTVDNYMLCAAERIEWQQWQQQQQN